jgi:hypothetical protein
MVFDGHGSMDGFHLANGTVKPDGSIDGSNTGKIAVDDMVSALSDRWKEQHREHPQDRELNISLIFSSCFSQNYVRSIAEELGRLHIPMPRLMISATEYSQYAWTSWNSPYGAQFNELLISSDTLGKLLENKEYTIHSTPSIFVPRKDDPTKPQQLGGIVVSQSNTAIG